MIVSFYDQRFKALANNASLSVDNASYKLVRRGVEFDELACVCEPIEEDINPTFIVVKTDLGNYLYGALAGIPTLLKENKTQINATDIKSILSSDILLNISKDYTSLDELFRLVFSTWEIQVLQSSFKITFNCDTDIALSDLKPAQGSSVVNAWEFLQSYLKFPGYNLFLQSKIDLVNKRIIFDVKKAMQYDLNIKLWEHGIKNYGKWVASVNETQGIVRVGANYIYGLKWILTSKSAITNNLANRDVYPIKRKLYLKETDNEDEKTQLINEVNEEALMGLCDNLFQENIELSGINADFETKCNIYVRRGEEIYKSMPIGELHYGENNKLIKVQVGYRFTGLEFIK